MALREMSTFALAAVEYSVLHCFCVIILSHTKIQQQHLQPACTRECQMYQHPLHQENVFKKCQKF